VRSMPAQIGFLKRKSRLSAPAFRQEAILRRRRMGQLRQQIERDEYKVSAVDIAVAMLREGVGRGKTAP